jgi:hypothetical protein
MNWHQNKTDYTHTRGVWNAVKKTTTNKNTKHTIEFSNNTFYLHLARFGATLPA